MSRYANMDHGGWLELQLKRKLSPFEHRAANIIGIVAGGIYNAPIKWATADFTERRVTVKWLCADFATWDFDQLTKLVLLAHAERIRISIAPVAPRYLSVYLTPRLAEGRMAQRHPSLDEVVADFRTWYRPLDRFIAPAAVEGVS